MTAQHGTLIAAEAYTEYRDIADGEDGKRIDRRVLFRMHGGKRMSARDVLTIQQRRAELIPQTRGRFSMALFWSCRRRRSPRRKSRRSRRTTRSSTRRTC